MTAQRCGFVASISEMDSHPPAVSTVQIAQSDNVEMRRFICFTTVFKMMSIEAFHREWRNASRRSSPSI
jgi:hypothetical protein